MVLEKTIESPLDCKEIQQVHPKGNQSWIFIRRADDETEKLVNTVNENTQDNCEQNDDEEGMKRFAPPEMHHNGNHSRVSAYREAG